MSNIVELELSEVGDGHVIPVEDLLEAAKGEGLRDVVIIGQGDNGFYVASSHGRPEAMMTIAFAQHWFCKEAFDE